ncbi:MAG: hypothetical protein QT03_C0001G0776 [archaeon GW2011_AR10]|uniref:Uncharacterized protein n=1 Tax=Candidatus Iainarchaeum sp. TaxID=3101447 RepID=A0A7J4J167_9ARCH|nr:MAG: hypothetical protein QT03_C0001G0776 [archaeon GW2011_AR10]HIH08956.1 hypothetical protein [Candidatus Diapherotrites archaeon]
MGLISLLTKSFFLGMLFLVLVIIGEMLFPGTVASTAFSGIGILIMVVAVTLDGIFNLGTVDEPKKKISRTT